HGRLREGHKGLQGRHEGRGRARGHSDAGAGTAARRVHRRRCARRQRRRAHARTRKDRLSLVMVRDAASSGRVVPYANHRIEVRTSLGRGRGVFAREAIAPGTVIEAAPAIILPITDCPTLDKTIIHNYYFHWDGDPDGEGRGAVGLGLVTL